MIAATLLQIGTLFLAAPNTGESIRIEKLPFVTRDVLEARDRDELACKHYVVTLEAFTTYVILMKDNEPRGDKEVRPFLRVEQLSPKDKETLIPVSDDNMHWNPACETHLVFTCPAEGSYKISATMRGSSKDWRPMKYALAVRPLESQRKEARGGGEVKHWTFSLPEDAMPDKDSVRGTAYREQPFVFEKDYVYEIEMRAASRIFTPYLRLENPQGRQVKSASARDIAGNGFADEYVARMVYYNRDDSKKPFKIIATSYAGHPGKFHLTVRAHKPHIREFTDGKEELCDQLTHADPKDNVLKFSPSKAYLYRFQAGFTYDIEMKALRVSRNYLGVKSDKKTSLALDAVLRLEDDGGRELAFNDDEDAGVLPQSSTDSRITFVCPRDMTYRVIASSLDAYYENLVDPQAGCGVFSLSVRKRPTLHRLKAGRFSMDARLTDDDPRDAAIKGSPSKVYAFHFEAEKTYAIHLESNAKHFAGFLRLEDDHRRQLDFNSDITGRNPNARIRFSCKHTGRYHIAVANVQQLPADFKLSVEQQE